MFWPWGGRLAYSLINLPILLIIFTNFFHNILNAAWITTSFNYKPPSMCVHTSHWFYGYPPFTLCPWQWTHRDPSCSLWHLCWHYMKWQFPCGTKIITRISINTTFNSYRDGIDIVFTKNRIHTLANLDIANPTCADLFPDLGQLKDLILQMQFKTKKNLLWLTPHWSISSSNNWNVWMFTQTNWCVLTQLCQCHSKLQRSKKPSFFCFSYFPW